MTNGYFVLVETGQTVQVSASFHPDGELDRVMLQTQDGRVLDLFTATNGVLYPAGDSEIKEANECSRLVQEFVNTLPGPEKK
jgi:hypothetical protein